MSLNQKGKLPSAPIPLIFPVYETLKVDEPSIVHYMKYCLAPASLDMYNVAVALCEWTLLVSLTKVIIKNY